MPDSKTYRVCHLSTVHSPFDQRIFHRECWTAHRAGYETHLIISYMGEEEKVDGIYMHSVNKTGKPEGKLRILHRIKLNLKALSIARSLKADIYQLHDPELIIVGIFLKLLTNGKVIFDCHENNTAYIKQKEYLPNALRWILYYGMFFLEILAAKILDAIITADAGVTKLYETRYGAKKVVLLHNFPRLDLFVIPDVAPPQNYQLVYHGTIPKYHLEVTFNVAEELKKRGILVDWLFFGSCIYKDWAEAEMKKRNLTNIHLDNKRIPHEEVAARVMQAQIGFIPLPDLPKFQHNIPTKLFEFMALRMPTILSDLPPSRPFIGEGEQACAIMVPPDDYQQYADAIALLIDNREKREKMGDIGYDLVTTKYNWEEESKKQLDLYVNMVS